MTVVTLLMLAFDDHIVVDGLHGDLRWLKVVHIDAGLKAVLAKVQCLAILVQVVGQTACKRKWTSVAGGQIVVVARAWKHGLSMEEVAWSEAETETWFHTCLVMRGKQKSRDDFSKMAGTRGVGCTLEFTQKFSPVALKA